MARHSFVKCVVLLIIIAGCIEQEKYKYCIEMTPCEQGVERKLTCSRDFSDEELERIAGLYENRINRHTFSGRFDANLPNDFGGAGFYMSFISNMGKTTVYSERFRGDDDLYAKLNQMGLRIDRFIDFLIGWLEYELGNDPNFNKLREFCDNNLRQDCKNFVCYFWLAGILSEYQDAFEEFGIRAMHYLLERDYMSQKRLLLLLESSKEKEEALYNIVRTIISDKMGYSDPNIAAERLKFLSDEEHFEKSMERYIPTTDLYKKMWESKKIEQSDPDAEPPETGDVLCTVLEEAGGEFDLFPPRYTIEVKLNCDSLPYSFNGKWDKEAQQLVWSIDTTNTHYFSIVKVPSLPAYFYSSWSTPDKKFQEEHFGRVILRHEDLAEYCMWHQGLDEKRAKEWNDFIGGLKPDQDIKKLVSVFRFPDDIRTEEDDLAKTPRELILDGLKGENKDDIKTITVEE